MILIRLNSVEIVSRIPVEIFDLPDYIDKSFNSFPRDHVVTIK